MLKIYQVITDFDLYLQEVGLTKEFISMYTSCGVFWSTTASGLAEKISTYHSGYASTFSAHLPCLASKSARHLCTYL